MNVPSGQYMLCVTSTLLYQTPSESVHSMTASLQVDQYTPCGLTSIVPPCECEYNSQPVARTASSGWNSHSLAVAVSHGTVHGIMASDEQASAHELKGGKHCHNVEDVGGTLSTKLHMEEPVMEQYCPHKNDPHSNSYAWDVALWGAARRARNGQDSKSTKTTWARGELCDHRWLNDSHRCSELFVRYAVYQVCGAVADEGAAPDQELVFDASPRHRRI